MSDAELPPVPPRPTQPAAAAAAQASTRPTGTAGYDPAADPDDTGVPTSAAAPADAGRGFLRALFDISFRTFITRRLASAFYVVGLIAIAIGFVYYFLSGLILGIGMLVPPFVNVGGGVALIVSTLIVVPIAAFLAVVVLRFAIEAVVALIAIAENTQRTAEHLGR
ncbi:DUF4282 domain-containing protein [Microbacterium sp. zg-YB36]|uniref:DUF4282 domain-containing protein n=1 Tax=Microbacterium sp. zg-YB36 TaxID=2969407 RepID=UPI00214CA4BA|nr:DUF4282 domain-containing protein [Microbacterium sp. zg-YB36]MDL5353023.1 DUF4282 domain-containing protein [Microbacterium sp. zg-YB36]